MAVLSGGLKPPLLVLCLQEKDEEEAEVSERDRSVQTLARFFLIFQHNGHILYIMFLYYIIYKRMQ